jgi:predicted glutamine amidotransferase
MCIAILNTKGTISKSEFKTCWNNNPDGGGLAWNEGGKLRIFKEMKDVNTLYQKYTSIRKQLPNNNILVHFRIATHGKVNETNCHPFRVSKDLVFIHNGMITGTGLPQSNEFSDTYLFNQLILQKLPKDFTRNEAITNLIAQYIDYSKLIFLDSADNWTIINEDLGEWNGDNWYSNKSYLCSTPHKKSSKGYVNSYDYYYYGYDENFCDCCQKSAATKYSTEYNAELCKDCYKEFVDYDK